MAAEINLDSMDEYAYIGTIKYHGVWRFFYDENRLKFVPNSNVLNNAPDKITNSPAFDKKTLDDYFASFETELTASQISRTVSKIPLSFIVNFDQQIFIDATGEEAEHLPPPTLNPDVWKWMIVNDPYYYVPSKVRELWVNKYPVHVENTPVENVGIYKWTYVGAVKFSSRWNFFYEMFGMWLLNFASFMSKSNRLNWPSDSIYGDWRKNIPVVDENNALAYIELLQNHNLEYHEIPKLTYILSESELELLQADQTKHLVLEKPELAFVVNFDDRIFVQKAYDFSQVRQNLDPEDKFVPAHWMCHQDNPNMYIPSQLNELWSNTR